MTPVAAQGKPRVDVRRIRLLARQFVRIAVPVLALAAIMLSSPNVAEAQYKSSQFGFEGGYMFVGEGTGLNSHGFLVGLRAAYKGSDHWWFSARAGLSFRGDIDTELGGSFRSNTVVLTHLVPVSARYYFLTDSTRPFLGITNSFQFLTNQESNASVFWGPGASGGIEFKLRRDLFLAFQADAYYMLVFGGDDTPLVTFTTQINFFL